MGTINPISSYLIIFSEWLSQNTQMGNAVLEIQVVNKFSTEKESFQYYKHENIKSNVVPKFYTVQP